jgi:predicted transcriptional regulator
MAARPAAPNLGNPMTFDDKSDVTELTARIVSAFVSRNPIPTSDLPDLIINVFDAVKNRTGQQEPEPEPQEPAIPIRRSVKPDSITCLECGKGFKSLKRHIRVEHQLDPQEYRAKWGLNKGYPMVAPNYAEARSKLAREMGLGRKPGEPAQRKSPGRGRRTKAGSSPESSA